MAIYGTKEVIDSRKSKQLLDFTNKVITSRGVNLEFDISPHIPNENMVDSSEITHTLTTTGDTVCQVFKASTDNLHDIHLTLQGSGLEDISENFESYANTAELEAEWVPSDAVNTFVTLDTTIVHSGSQSMAIQCRKNQSPGDTITRDLGVGGVDWSSYANLNFWVWNPVDLTCIWQINIIDNTANKASLQYNQPPSQWFEQDLSFFDFSNFANMDWDDIRYIQFEMVSCTSALHTFYIDDMELHGPAGDIEIELIDFGTSAPVSGDDITVEGSVLTLDDGNISLSTALGLTKKIGIYHMHYGSHDYDNELTIGNYYGFHIKNPTSGECKVYGSLTQKYNSASCFSVNGSDIMTDVERTCYFTIHCTCPALLTKIEVETDESAGSSQMLIHTIDSETDKMEDDIIRHIFHNDRTLVTEFMQDDVQLFYCDRRYKPICNFADIGASSASTISINTYWLYEPVEENG